MKSSHCIYKVTWATALITFVLACSAQAQVRAGAAFLKVLPGARMQSMGGVGSALLDDPHAMFANAGATGLFHEWQWAAGYTKWVADISQASFIYGRRLPTPISRNTRLAFGVLYQCVGEFDNSGGSLPPASAGDAVFSLSLGQPFMLDKTVLSFGAGVKYLNSSLAHYTAHTLMYDAGLTVKSPQIPLGRKYLGTLGLGGAVANLGKGLVFDQIESPLPLSVRWGLSAYLGASKGLQLLLTADYVAVKDEEDYITLGGEILINRLISLNAGYNFGNDLFKKFTVGAGIRLDDTGAAIGKAFPSRHNAFRLDFASLDGAEYFSRTYRGTASHFSTVPEPFARIFPANDDTVAAQTVLRWQSAVDHDVFDRVGYRLLVDRDSSAVAHVLGAYDKNPELFAALVKGRMLYNVESERTFYPLAELTPGDYYWAVIAADRDGQVRFAERDSRTIARFHVPSPPIEIKEIQFEHHPYITADDFQGVIRVMLANPSNRSSKPMTLRLEDGVEAFDYSLESIVVNDPSLVLPDRSIQQQSVPSIGAGESLVVEFPWHTPLQGKHKLRFTLEAGGVTAVQDERIFYTIPKGSLAPDDTVLTVTGRKKIIDLPLINEITFDKGSAAIKSDYTSPAAVQPILAILAERLRENTHQLVQLQGFIDALSGEHDPALADARALAVQNALIELGVEVKQIILLKGTRTPHRFLPANTEDQAWILEERRFVRITAANGDAVALFAPIRREEAEYGAGEVMISAKIKSVLPLHGVAVNSAADQQTFSQAMPVFDHKKDISTMVWHFNPNNLKNVLNRAVTLTLTITDSLGRSFTGMPFDVHVEAKETITEHVCSIPAQFAGTGPVEQLYWKRLTQLAQTMADNPEMRVRFEGHACSIGGETVNRSLSQRRAERFSQEFRQLLSRQNGYAAGGMIQRIDQPVGWGESRPLLVDGKTGLCADNESAVGRKLNRRIEIIFYQNAPPF